MSYEFHRDNPFDALPHIFYRIQVKGITRIASVVLE